MLIKPDDKYIKELSSLWSNVFGDEDGYISLLFDKEFYICDTFVKFVGDKIAAALYLLNCNLSYNGKTYNGKYLYAAATAPEFRKKGNMAELIKEAQGYCHEQGVDFISLVPANEKLYSYYSNFGFCESMYRYETLIKNLSEADCETAPVIKNTETIMRVRETNKSEKLSYNNEDWHYALSCLKYTGNNAYLNSSDSYYIADYEKKIVAEFMSSSENLDNNLKEMLRHFKGDIKVYSPCDLSKYGETKPVKYGMIFPVNCELAREWNFTDIYMNLALD